MNRKLFLTLLFFLTLAAKSQIFEGFEELTFPPSNWTVSSNNVGNGQQWQNGRPIWMLYEGTGVAIVHRENIGINNTSEAWLTSPAIAVSGGATLSFFLRQTIAFNQNTLFQVRISTTSQTDHSSFTVLEEWTDLQMAPDFSFQEFIVPLQAFAGQTIYIAFVRKHTQLTENTDGDRFSIDNVSIPNGFLKTSEFANGYFNIFPNPATTMIHIDVPNQTEIRGIKLYNALGQEVNRLHQGFQKIDVSQLKSGIYFLQLQTDKGESTQRFIKI